MRSRSIKYVVHIFVSLCLEEEIIFRITPKNNALSRRYRKTTRSELYLSIKLKLLWYSTGVYCFYKCTIINFIRHKTKGVRTLLHAMISHKGGGLTAYWSALYLPYILWCSEAHINSNCWWFIRPRDFREINALIVVRL